jgi:hypothetical protein
MMAMIDAQHNSKSSNSQSPIEYNSIKQTYDTIKTFQPDNYAKNSHLVDKSSEIILPR